MLKKIICDGCGIEFDREKVKKGKNFHSPKCYTDYARKNRKGWFTNHNGVVGRADEKFSKKMRANNQCV